MVAMAVAKASHAQEDEGTSKAIMIELLGSKLDSRPDVYRWWLALSVVEATSRHSWCRTKFMEQYLLIAAC